MDESPLLAPGGVTNDPDRFLVDRSSLAHSLTSSIDIHDESTSRVDSERTFYCERSEAVTRPATHIGHVPRNAG